MKTGPYIGHQGRKRDGGGASVDGQNNLTS